MRALFISDLHLHAEATETQGLAARFLTTELEPSDSLYIIGDLFDTWIGDDDPVEWAAPFINALRAVSSQGTSVHLLHGNRDFLLGQDFATRVGATLHTSDSIVITAGDTVALAMHGDTLCTDDTDYQSVRKLVRSATWQAQFLAKSLTERRTEAAALRAESRTATANKQLDITDANATACLNALNASAASVLIHGHTHRPCVHTCGNGKRLVLGEWLASGMQYVELTEQSQNLISWPPKTLS